MPALHAVGETNTLRLTRGDANRLRQLAAQKGHVVGEVRSDEEYVRALLATLSPEEIEALHQAIVVDDVDPTEAFER